ncbi:MAG: TIR domain-containing protein [Anaerolineae bacterium]|nr:TIR domain-containing protein [Anaerolineae bacterium]
MFELPQRKRRIILVEDDEIFYKQLLRVLRQKGYEVTLATDVDDARFQLHANHFHVAIVDIFLNAGKGPSQIGERGSGERLLSDIHSSRLNDVLTRIILTNYPDVDLYSRALGEWGVFRALKKYSDAHEEDYVTLLTKALDEAFDSTKSRNERQRARINHSVKLNLEFQVNSDLEVIPKAVEHIIEHEGPKISSLLTPEDKWKSLPSESLISPDVIALQVYDLLNELFYNEDKLFLSTMSSGLTGAAIIRARPSGTTRGLGQRYVVKIGRRDKIEREYKNYSELVSPKFTGGAVTAAAAASTRDLGAICYRFAENERGSELREFDVLFKNHEIRNEAICQGLRFVFERTFRLLYGERNQEIFYLPDDYYQAFELEEKGRLQRVIDEVLENDDVRKYVVEFDPHSPQFKIAVLKDALLNPFLWLETHRDRCILPAYRCVTHGDLTGRNIMTDTTEYIEHVQGKTFVYHKMWLIDFYRTGESHILRDLVVLESDIKYRLAEKLDLPDFITLEKHLLGLETINEEEVSDNLLLARTSVIIEQIRQLCREQQGFPTAPDDESEILVAVLMATLNVIRLKHVTTEKKIHALISASLICSRLESLDKGYSIIPDLRVIDAHIPHESNNEVDSMNPLTRQQVDLFDELAKGEVILFVGRRSGDDPSYLTPFHLMTRLMREVGYSPLPEDTHRSMASIFVKKYASRDQLLANHIAYFSVDRAPDVFRFLPGLPWKAIFTTNQHSYIEGFYNLQNKSHKVIEDHLAHSISNSDVTHIYKLYGTLDVEQSSRCPLTEQEYESQENVLRVQNLQRLLLDLLFQGSSLLMLYPSSTDIRIVQGWKATYALASFKVWTVGNNIPLRDIERMDIAGIQHLDLSPDELTRTLASHLKQNGDRVASAPMRDGRQTHDIQSLSLEESMYNFDIALSCAGEDTAYVDLVADCLKANGTRVFYYKFDHAQIDLWGKDLYVHLDEIYRKKARYCVMFLSKAYAQKLWTTHERRSAQARAFQASKEYILPVRFDDTEIPGIVSTIGYVNANRMTPQELCQQIIEKLKSK